MAESVEVLQERLGYRFRRLELLERALTHRSLAAERDSTLKDIDNEPLEFLGDAVLGFVVSEYLFQLHPQAREGQLSQLKAQVVSSAHLYRCALRLDLGQFLLLGHGEERSGGRQRKRLLANALEAIIAAVQLDGGLEPAQKLIREHILAFAECDDMSAAGLQNSKSALQERALALGMAAPKYVTVGTSGPEHAKVFTVEARMGDRTSSATGSSKKAASQEAAHLLMAQLEQAAAGSA